MFGQPGITDDCAVSQDVFPGQAACTGLFIRKEFDLESQLELPLRYDDDDRLRTGGPRFVWLFRLQLTI